MATTARRTGRGLYPLPPVVDPAVESAIKSLENQRSRATDQLLTEQDAGKRRQLQVTIDILNAIWYASNKHQIAPCFNRAGLGTKVTYMDPEFEAPQVIHILRSGDRDIFEDGISIEADMARCFLGHVAGDTVKCCGTKYVIIAVERSEHITPKDMLVAVQSTV